MIDVRRAFSLDWLLLVLALMLLGLGMLMIGSATTSASRADTPLLEMPAIRQGINAAVALVALIAVSLINYRVWAVWRWVLYGGMLAGLLLVLLAGRVIFGAQSWFEVWFFALQPSELSKIVLIIVLASYFGEHEEQVKRGTGIFVSLLLLAPFLALIYAQPDMGTAAILLAIWLGMLFVAGVRLQHLALLGVAAIVIAPLVWSSMEPYMRERILLSLNPQADPSDKGYNMIQALISVGSGGLWGKGLGQGSQSQLAFLRVRHTDFIFSVLAEELGLVGSGLLLLLFALLLLRIVRVSSRAGEGCGRLLASGVATMIFAQVAVNVGYNVRLLPVTGLPLPLISYGGSSLIATLMGLGLVESVALHREPPETQRAMGPVTFSSP
jgi:rod shape determining protein RodA